MRATGRRATVALASALAVTVLLPDIGSTGATTDNACYRYRRAERRFVRRINIERNAVGLKRLRLDPELAKVARYHTREMIARGEPYHQSPKQLTRRITNWASLGENVGAGGTVLGLHAAFMESPVHAANVFGKGYRRIGVGTIKRDGRLWVTILFEAVDNPGTRLKMPAC